MNTTTKSCMLPLAAFNVYMIATLCLFLWGPIHYKFITGQHKVNVLIFIAFFVILTNVFYRRAVTRRIRPARFKLKFRFRNRYFSTLSFVKLCILYAALLQLLLIIQNAAAHGISSFSFSNFFSTMATTYTDFEYETTLAAKLLSYTGICKLVCIFGGYVNWNKLSLVYKSAFISTIVCIILNNILFVGSQKQLVDLFIFLFIAVAYKQIKTRGKVGNTKMILAIIVVFLAVICMGFVISARTELWAKRYNSGNGGLPLSSYIDYTNVMFRILPRSIIMPITLFSGYLSQGYRGLALCLTLPFEPSWGMGFSFKLMNDVSRWLSIPLAALENSYPIRMAYEYGIDAYSNWHTIFPWFASDVTFIGALIIIVAFMYLWGRSWSESLKTNNLFSALMFAQLSILVLYIPCNNQLFQTRESIVTTIIIMLLWYSFHGETPDENRTLNIDINTIPETLE